MPPAYRRMLALVGVSAGLAALGNAISPWGISWADPLGPGLRGRAAQAGLPPVTLAAVRETLRSRSVLFLDARPPEEFEVGHLPGARSFAWRDVDEGKPPSPLPPPDQPLVVYCDNEFCESAFLLAQWLRARGFRDVGLFIEGYEAWWNGGGMHESE